MPAERRSFLFGDVIKPTETSLQIVYSTGRAQIKIVWGNEARSARITEEKTWRYKAESAQNKKVLAVYEEIHQTRQYRYSESAKMVS